MCSSEQLGLKSDSPQPAPACSRCQLGPAALESASASHPGAGRVLGQAVPTPLLVQHSYPAGLSLPGCIQQDPMQTLSVLEWQMLSPSQFCSFGAISHMSKNKNKLPFHFLISFLRTQR